MLLLSMSVPGGSFWVPVIQDRVQFGRAVRSGTGLRRASHEPQESAGPLIWEQDQALELYVIQHIYRTRGPAPRASEFGTSRLFRPRTS